MTNSTNRTHTSELNWCFYSPCTTLLWSGTYPPSTCEAMTSQENLRATIGSLDNMGLINKGWYGMFVACGIWCLTFWALALRRSRRLLSLDNNLLFHYLTDHSRISLPAGANTCASVLWAAASRFFPLGSDRSLAINSTCSLPSSRANYIDLQSKNIFVQIFSS